MNIKVLGWYGHGNVGDEAYKSSFPLLFPNHQIEFVEKISPDDAPDLVILGGGDVVYPSFTEQVAKLPPSTRKLAASVSVTDNSDFPALKIFERVLVRDYRSALLSNQHGTNAVYQPDFTFMLEPDPELGREWLTNRFKTEGHILYDKVIVCVVSNYLAYNKLDMMARDLTSFLSLSQNIAQTADETPASFIFLPFSTKAPRDDRVANSWAADRCKYYDKNLVVWEELDVQTTLNVISAANAVVSSRLHSSIFSTIAGVPFVDLTHHTKNIGFIETIEKTQWSMPFGQFSVKDFKALLHKFIANPLPDTQLEKFSRLAKDHLRVATIL